MPIYADYGSQAGTIIGFVYYTNWTYQTGTLTLMPAGTRANRQPERVADDGLAAADCICCRRTLLRLFQAHAALFSEYPLYGRPVRWIESLTWDRTIHP